MLVDDNIDDQYIHSRVIRKNGFAKKIVECHDGEEALNYLSSLIELEGQDQEGKIPDLIFLDLNMPKIDGFEFIEAYQNMPDHFKKSIMIIMQSTSIKPKDYDKVEKSECIHDFINKPLNEAHLIQIWEKFFADNE